MKTSLVRLSWQGFKAPAAGPLVLALLVWLLPVDRVVGQSLTLANPHWNITLTDAGYSDFLLDNTPGFEGREYLSGEWGVAVGYEVGGVAVAPQWLESQFVYPDWVTGTSFQVKVPITQVGLNADGLPIAQSVVENNHLEITLRHEMVDTVVGTPMGVTAASDAGSGAPVVSSRYVLKQTVTVKAKPGTPVAKVQLFQFLHGLQSQRGVYDNRLYDGVLGEYRHDLTLAGVDAWAVGAGSSDAGLEDYLGFHANRAPSGFEVGPYGVEGNGIDDHWSGKPTVGVHLSVENNWMDPPYSARVGTDRFAPAQRWVAGAQRWDLGDLAGGQAAGLDLLLTLRTGTKVSVTDGGGPSRGGCNGGSGVPGGLDYEFEDVSSEGSCFAEYSQADDDEIGVRVAAGELGPLDFPCPGKPVQLWEVAFNGVYSGQVRFTVGYDPSILPTGFDEELLCLYQWEGGAWHRLEGVVDALGKRIEVTTAQVAPLALGVSVGGPSAPTMFDVAASGSPAEGGAVQGAGSYVSGSSITLTAVPVAGYVFAGWFESGALVSASPNYTFQVLADRDLQASFVPVGAARSVVTSSLPVNGGTTAGDGAYSPGTVATVTAVPASGYKFSKWLEDGVVVSTSASYAFTVTGDRSLVAKFKPVYTVTVVADPVSAGDEDFEVEGDGLYEPGELAKMKVKPVDGYSFVNWTQNGGVVSTDPFFKFNVTGNRDLVGHFAPGHRIDATVIPPHAGTVVGTGVYEGPVVLEAEPEAGYVFLYWASADLPDEPVATESPYLFTPGGSVALVAHFGLAPPAGNSAPLGGADTFIRLDNTRVAKVLLSELLGNDADADGDPLTVVSVGDAWPTGATVGMSGAFAVYTASAENAGDGGFTYVLSDGPGGHLVTVLVTVTESPAQPVDTGANAVRIRSQDGSVEVTFLGVPGHTYRVQYTETLSPPSWLDFNPAKVVTAPPDGVFTQVDGDPSQVMRFYRAIRVP